MPRIPKTYRASCIVLNRTKLSEQDLIVTMLADTGEQVRAVAKGGRKPGSRLSGPTDYFCVSDMLIRRGKGSLDFISEAHLENAHTSIRGDMDKYSAAAAIIEIARVTSYEDAPDAFGFPICAKALDICERTDTISHLNLLVAAYIFKILAHLGWRPNLDCCVLCSEEDLSYFSCEAGGVVCSSCASEAASLDAVDKEDIRWIEFLLMATFDQIVQTDILDHQALWLLKLAHRWAATHLDLRLIAVEFMAGVQKMFYNENCQVVFFYHIVFRR